MADFIEVGFYFLLKIIIIYYTMPFARSSQNKAARTGDYLKL